MATPYQGETSLQSRPRHVRLTSQVRHFADDQLQFRFQRQQPMLLRLIEQELEPLQGLLRQLQIGFGEHQQVLDPHDQPHGSGRCLSSVRPAVMAQYASQRFMGQVWPALLQPEMTADLQQHAAIHRVGNLPLLHQSLGIAQAIKRMGVIALIGRHLGLPEKAIQRTLVVTEQAVLKTDVEEFTGHFVLPLTKRQAPAPQSNPPQQWRRTIRLSRQQLMNIGQQAFGTPGSAALLQ
ncbi:hypothetical protein D3C85_985150 [compost metagenome]